MSSGEASSATCAASGPPSPASPTAGSARLPTITGWTNSTATWRASERAAGEAPSGDQPAAAREALRHPVAEPRDAVGLGGEEAAVGLRALGEQRLDPAGRRAGPHAGAPARVASRTR